MSSLFCQISSFFGNFCLIYCYWRKMSFCTQQIILNNLECTAKRAILVTESLCNWALSFWAAIECRRGAFSPGQIMREQMSRMQSTSGLRSIVRRDSGCDGNRKVVGCLWGAIAYLQPPPSTVTHITAPPPFTNQPDLTAECRPSLKFNLVPHFLFPSSPAGGGWWAGGPVYGSLAIGETRGVQRAL